MDSPRASRDGISVAIMINGISYAPEWEPDMRRLLVVIVAGYTIRFTGSIDGLDARMRETTLTDNHRG